MSKGMIGKLPLHVWREPRDILDSQLIGSEGPTVVLPELKKFVKFERCWIESRTKPTVPANGEHSIGMFGLLPLKSMQGTLNALDQLGAGPKGELVRLELLKFLERRPCWVKDDKSIVVRNRHSHVVITVTGLRLRGDEEIDRLQAAGYEVTETAIRYFCSDEEHNVYTADHLLQQDRRYSIVLVPRSEITARVRSHFDAMRYLTEHLTKKFGYHVPLAGIAPRLCEAIPDEMLEHLGIDRIVVASDAVYPEHESYSRGTFEFTRDKEGHRTLRVNERAWDSGDWNEPDFLPYSNSTAFAFFVEPVKKPARKYVDSVKLDDKTADKELKAGTVIRVNRKILPAYPNWVMRVVHPDIQNMGPEEFDLTNLEQWRYEDQKPREYVSGDRAYEHLKKTGMLERCLGLRDGEEIMKKGHKVFQRAFGSSHPHVNVLLWKSVVEYRRRHVENEIDEIRRRNLHERGDRGWHEPIDPWEKQLRVPHIFGQFWLTCMWRTLGSHTIGNDDVALMFPK